MTRRATALTTTIVTSPSYIAPFTPAAGGEVIAIAGPLTTESVVDLGPVLEVCSLEFDGRSEETMGELTSAKPTPSGEPPRRDNTTHHILGSRPICLELLTRRIGPPTMPFCGSRWSQHFLDSDRFGRH